ncbi:HET-domain-containing protein [Hypoxylon sp. FL0543]|nr:HET-domain-containing protein [Hypoxylon sp. FL0543]
MSSKVFQYSPLDPNLREIRVLILHPGNFEDPLRVSIEARSLDSSAAYNALSYVWGDATSAGHPGNTIRINEHDFPVTANLRAALRHLRPAGAADPITLWVDAVCINQADLDERRRQVSMMRDIYASAEQVIIWLGEADDESDLVFDALPMLAARSHRPGGELDEELLRATRLCSGFFSGLMDQRPWFSRVWIIQELAMAKQDPLVVCERKSVTWSTLMKASMFVARNTFPETDMVRREPRDDDDQGDNSTGEANDLSKLAVEDIEIFDKWKVDVLNDLYESMKSQGGENLQKLLLISRTSDATDPRDRVYALLGLLKPGASDSGTCEDSIDVDYRKAAADVYADATAYIFAQGEGPYFLSGMFLPGISAAAPHIPSLPPTTSQPHLPSWVPDFSRQVAGKATQPNGTLFHPPAAISASGVGAGCDNGRRLSDKRTLQVEGLFVDTIEDVLFLGSSLGSYLGQLAHVERLAKAAKERPCQLEPSVRAHMEQFKRKEPFWRALISNKRFASGYDIAPASYEAMYLSLRDASAEGDDSNTDITRDQQNEYMRSLESKLGKKSFFTTKSGFIGTCVPDSRKGDIIAILFGSPVPFVLRPRSDTVQVEGAERPTHSLVGASYVSGIMSGEMVDELYCEDLMDSMTFFIR